MTSTRQISEAHESILSTYHALPQTRDSAYLGMLETCAVSFLTDLRRHTDPGKQASSVEYGMEFGNLRIPQIERRWTNLAIKEGVDTAHSAHAYGSLLDLSEVLERHRSDLPLQEFEETYDFMAGQDLFEENDLENNREGPTEIIKPAHLSEGEERHRNRHNKVLMPIAGMAKNDQRLHLWYQAYESDGNDYVSIQELDLEPEEARGALSEISEYSENPYTELMP
jgi:hypothetical protein